ncbi:MAG: hypothetical protein KJ556_08375 [Gammaproteobacteria bacterium]|nr:hypothetical protein [Gammaproteobacteria bacterium]MBU2057066.1 hypothetical protein [Gammaproteobacteria bacterium]MBU2175125.1 hypothetical protein [Gammaproteobacteria bacterium]MBU2245156.1 hypothetical protein [Gammaproteobacteria bacterium]MBU2343977.1 hypothetical protein [Gammaproteobacteria bacterium]
MKFLFVVLTVIVFALPHPLLANKENTSSRSHHPEMNIVEIKKRLSISAEQETKFSPVLEQHVKERSELFKKYGLDKEGASISIRNLKSFRSEMLALSDNTNKKLADILTESQLKEWGLIQEESRAELRRGFSL